MCIRDREKQLKDDHGELFGFGTHMFRHYYGVKLTEMHLDDWTIARLLGHKRLNNVQPVSYTHLICVLISHQYGCKGFLPTAVCI